MGVCPGKSNWKCNRILLRDTLPFCTPASEYTKKIEKDNIAVFFHRILPVFDRKSVVG